MTDDNAGRGLGTADKTDAGRRSALLTMARVLAYAPPVVATFTMAGLSVREAHAYVTNTRVTT